MKKIIVEEYDDSRTEFIFKQGWYLRFLEKVDVKILYYVKEKNKGFADEDIEFIDYDRLEINTKTGKIEFETEVTISQEELEKKIRKIWIKIRGEFE